MIKESSTCYYYNAYTSVTSTETTSWPDYHLNHHSETSDDNLTLSILYLTLTRSLGTNLLTTQNTEFSRH